MAFSSTATGGDFWDVRYQQREGLDPVGVSAQLEHVTSEAVAVKGHSQDVQGKNLSVPDATNNYLVLLDVCRN